ncbi:hypothetical protein NEDG_02109 [Nematocida displodere]|uniref:Uncharacterized protein n=1 Tax=Nematocida displodere TaxID=1805483 RepID=A0A177ELE4_9MICR|nr:hypothetical protein NEDG_02109 [Nematocida displodere]
MMTQTAKDKKNRHASPYTHTRSYTGMVLLLFACLSHVGGTGKSSWCFDVSTCQCPIAPIYIYFTKSLKLHPSLFINLELDNFLDANPDHEDDTEASRDTRDPFLTSAATAETLKFFADFGKRPLRTVVVNSAARILKHQTGPRVLHLERCPLNKIPENLAQGMVFKRILVYIPNPQTPSRLGGGPSKKGTRLLKRLLLAFQVAKINAVIIQGQVVIQAEVSSGKSG